MGTSTIIAESPITRSALYQKHKLSLDKAIRAVHERTFYAHYPENPSPKIYGENADKEGYAAFQMHLGKPYKLLQSKETYLTAEEKSPYTGEVLGISYPTYKYSDDYLKMTRIAFDSWKKTDIYTRAGILMESLERIKVRFFELAYATMHTTGQSFSMSFQASGPHSIDRALEAIALGMYEQTRFPEKVEWIKPLGKTEVHLEKTYKNVPKGVGLCIGCSTFPVWNMVPGLYADLITGNCVVVKPHPNAVYAIALVIDEIQKLLKENNLDVNTVMLAVDTSDTLITQELAEHENIRMIDFTGGSTFGDYIESIPNKTTFTEKAGVNSVIFDSFENWDKVIENLAFSVSLYSGQMCTSPQNFFIPQSGVRIGNKLHSYEEMVQMLVDGIYNFAQNPKYRNVFGALKCNKTVSRVKMAEKMGAIVLLHSENLVHTDFPNAKLVSPTILEAPSDRVDIYEQELFGPILLVIPTENTEHSIQLAKFLAIERGAISCAAYTTDEEVMQLIAEEMAEACTPVSFNFTGNFWVNQNAGFSDFHVTGGNPSGNASLTNPEFIRKRYSVVGMRVFKENK